MVRHERGEPPGGFLELALAAHAPPSSGLVPRDGHVNEPLEEVALAGCRGAPGLFERLVGSEELAGGQEREAPLVAVLDDGFITHAGR